MEIKLTRGHFYETPLKSASFAGFVLTEATYPANHKLPRHSHERACFMRVLQGSVAENYATKTLAAEPSALIFRPPGEVHSDRFHDAGGRLFLIEIERWWLDRLGDHAKELCSSAGPYVGALTLLSTKIYREFRERDSLSSLVVEGLALEMIAEVARSDGASAAGKPPHWLKQARDLLHARFSEQISLTEVSRSVGVHPVYLGQVFRTHYRCTPGEYVRRLRIEFVCHKLVTSKLTLSDIALLAGFSDQSHLTRHFKRQIGMTPARYRAFQR